MINVDMKALLSKLNSFCTNTLHNAAGLCVSRTHYEVTVEHFFVKALEDANSDIPLILRRFEIDPARLSSALSGTLEELKTGNAGKPVFSPPLIELLQSAWMYASVDLSEADVRSGAVLLAFLSKPALFAGGGYADVLASISRDALIQDFWTIVKGSSERKAPAATAAGRAESAAPAGAGFIEKYCTDFTDKAKQGDIDPVFGRDHELRECVDILARRRKNNPILVGEPGVGKTAVIEGLALRIVEADVPDMLKDTTLLGLDMGSLQAGAGMKGEFENRLKGVLNEIKSSEKSIILFIDEAHTLIGAGGSAGGSDAANLLKPALARGEIRTCAATTWSEYKKYFEKDPALARRFQLVKLDEPDVATSVLILRGLKANYETAHKVVVRDDAIESAAELSDRYISGRFLPDKAIDLLDTSCARIKVNLSAKPAALEDKERTIQALQREQKGLERDRTNGLEIDEDKYQATLASIEKTTGEAESIKERWLKEQEAARRVVDIREQIQALGQAEEQVATDSGQPAEGTEPAPAQDPEQAKAELKQQLEEAGQALVGLQGDDPLIQIEVSPDVVAQVVADWTGVPVGKMLRDQAQTVIHLEEVLKQRIKGQDQPLETIAEVIRAGKSGIKNPNSPLGVFLLVGPSGVGKTETGLALAEQLFGGERNVVTINMSEFQESHTVSRLIGSPPGYVGFGEGGMLTEAVRQHPYSVVLLDEVEKAHIDVMNLFYQVFDKGMLADGEGKEINFKNTVMILTSNLGTDVIQEMTTGEERPPLDAVLGAVRPMLSQHFKPALLARMTVIPYFSLDPEAMKNIVELKLNNLKKMLLENNKMKMEYSPAVIDQITTRCTEVETGARNIEYILNGNVLPQLSKTILTHMAEGAMPSQVNLDVEEDGSFKMDFGAE
ncbi:MAG: type VI secretion system ATPase TssH [Proteobacteria bacterium]|nr:type VI secretion system ATPase TssH [Pseudomonadota bacterium]